VRARARARVRAPRARARARALARALARARARACARSGARSRARERACAHTRARACADARAFAVSCARAPATMTVATTPQPQQKEIVSLFIFVSENVLDSPALDSYVATTLIDHAVSSFLVKHAIGGRNVFAIGIVAVWQDGQRMRWFGTVLVREHCGVCLCWLKFLRRQMQTAEC